MASAENIPKWIDFIREAGKKDIKVYVLGNKSDLESEILGETKKLAEDLAEKQAEFYQEVSAKTNANIEDLFNRVIDDLQASQTKKKEVPTSTTVTSEVENKPVQNEEEGKVKLGSAGSANDGGNRGWANCCQQ